MFVTIKLLHFFIRGSILGFVSCFINSSFCLSMLAVIPVPTGSFRLLRFELTVLLQLPLIQLLLQQYTLLDVIDDTLESSFTSSYTRLLGDLNSNILKHLTGLQFMYCVPLTRPH